MGGHRSPACVGGDQTTHVVGMDLAEEERLGTRPGPPASRDCVTAARREAEDQVVDLDAHEIRAPALLPLADRYSIGGQRHFHCRVEPIKAERPELVRRLILGSERLVIGSALLARITVLLLGAFRARIRGLDVPRTQFGTLWGASPTSRVRLRCLRLGADVGGCRVRVVVDDVAHALDGD